MGMPERAAALLLLALALGSPLAARADWVRDEVRILLRSGAGFEYRILKTLKTGDQVERLGSQSTGQGEWARVRAPDGLEGWVEAAYLSSEPPAALELPRVRSKLAQAEKRVAELEAQASEQAHGLQELEFARSHAKALEVENERLTSGALWWTFFAGAAVALAGIGLGVVLPRGSAARARRIKL
jgi:SH3 domain protein